MTAPPLLICAQSFWPRLIEGRYHDCCHCSTATKTQAACQPVLSISYTGLKSDIHQKV